MLLLLFYGIGTDTTPADTSGHHVVGRRRRSPLRFDVVAEPLRRDEDEDVFLVRIL